MTEQQHTFTTYDGTELFYRYRPARADASKGAIVLFHRGHEHSGRLMYLADELALDDFAYFAWDARGHGHSPGERGDSPSIGTSVADVAAFMEHIQQTYRIKEENIVVIAQSVGAVLVATWLHDYAPNIRCAILAAPAFKVKLYVPFARTGLRLWQKLRGNFYVQSYVKAHYLTHDPERIASFNSDPLITRAISVRILLGLYQASARVVADAAAITTPIQLLVSGDDKVVYHKPQHDFYNRLGSHIKTRLVLPGFYHDTLGEKDRHIAIDAIRTFINARFAAPVHSVDLSQAHLFGFTRVEADELATPLSITSFKGFYWAAVRKLLHFGGNFSQGLKIGRETGYDSGSSLDYIYQNQPCGTNALGRFFDKNYLNAIGWRRIRQRKINIGKAVSEACKRLRHEHKPVHVLDIASGHGRYVLDAFSDEVIADSIRLRDFSDINVDAGRKMIAKRGLSDKVSFDKVDAFNRQNYQQLSPKPTLGIVSGLHELFDNNDLINQSLLGFSDALDLGGYLIYTNQPWHPQLELIARCLTSHQQGRDWVMRRRTQAEMDQLVADAGFKKVKQWIDEDGIFSVCLAQRVPANSENDKSS